MAQAQRDTTSVFPEKLRGAIDAADRDRLIIVATVGYGLCRIASGAPAELSGLLFSRTIADAGKLCGILCLAAASLAPAARRPDLRLVLAPSVLALCATLLACVAAFLPGQAFGAAGSAGLFLSNFGSAAFMLQWLELIACAPMRRIVLSIAGAELINSLFTLSMGAGSHLPASATALALGASTALFMFCRRGWETSPHVSIATARRSADTPGSLVSRRLMLWVAFYCLAYGFVTSHSGMRLESVGNNVGGIVPSLLILSVAALAPARFDLRLLKSIAFALMVSGLLLVAMLGADSPLVQALAGSGAASCRLCGYSLACMHARARKVSSLAGCAAVKTLIVVGTVVGLEAGALGLPAQGRLVVLGLALAACLLNAFLSPFDLDEEALIKQAVDAGRTRSRRELLEAAAREAGLSPRETTVFALMASGMDAAQIAEDLFISKSAVRAHQSRIYAKFGVHSQEEFDATIPR